MDTGYIVYNPRNFDRLWDIPTATAIDTNTELWTSSINSLRSVAKWTWNPVIISTSAEAPEEEFDERWFDLLEE